MHTDRPGPKVQRPGPSIPPAEYERAKTHLTAIAEALLENPEYERQGDERVYRHSGGLSINMRGRGWFSHAGGVGGTSAFALVRHLRPDYTVQQAVAWLTAYLGANPGDGPCGAADSQEVDAHPGSEHECRAVLADAQDIPGTVSEKYLISRGAHPPYPDGLLLHLPHARIGESALVTLLTAHGRTVGVQLTYLDARGKKSPVKPRRRLNLEKAPGAAFVIPAPDPAAALDALADYLVCEGLEDGLSLRLLGRNATILAVPGIGNARHLDLPPRSRVIIVRDGDEEHSTADKALINAVDHLLLAGHTVRVTATPRPDAGGKFDANRLLQEQGLEALRALVIKPVEATLSYNGRIIGLRGISPTKDRERYARERAAIHTIFKVSTKDIDADVKQARWAHLMKEARAPGATSDADTDTDTDGADAPGSYEGAEDAVWEGDVDLVAVLNRVLEILPRFLQAPGYVHVIIVLWVAMTHLVQSEEVNLAIAPQLGFSSLVEGSGKSVAAEIVATLAYRGYLRASYTASTLFRRISEEAVTPCLSEFHNILGDKDKDMLAIIDACHRRSEAWVDRTETDPQTGKRSVVSYRCWTALSWGAIGGVPREAYSRSIVLPLQAALPDESRALDHSQPRQSPDLIDARRQLAKWSTSIKALPTPTMPATLFNRAADNFRPLFAIAELAGGEWPQRIREAAEEVCKIERAPSLQVRLLTGIRDAFIAIGEIRLSTKELIDQLCEDAEAGWQGENHGKRINEYWLREHLRGLINPPGSQQWRDGKVLIRGYELRQFEDAILRYLPLDTYTPYARERSRASWTSGTSGTEPASEHVSPSKPAENAVPDAVPDVPHHPGQGNDSRFNGLGDSVPDVPDVPDAQAGSCVNRECVSDTLTTATIATCNDRDASLAPEPTVSTGSLADTLREGSAIAPSASTKPNGAESASSTTDVTKTTPIKITRPQASPITPTVPQAPPIKIMRPQSSSIALTIPQEPPIKITRPQSSPPRPNEARAPSDTLERPSPAPKPPPGGRIAAMIRDTAKAHPDWTAAQIGEHCGRTESEVRRILNAEVGA